MIRNTPPSVRAAGPSAEPVDPMLGLLPLTLARPLEPRLMLDAAAVATIDLVAEPADCGMEPGAEDLAGADGEGDAPVEWSDESFEDAFVDEGLELPVDETAGDGDVSEGGEPLEGPPNPPEWLVRRYEVGDEWLPDVVDSIDTGDAQGGEVDMIHYCILPDADQAGPPNPPVLPEPSVVAAGPRDAIDPPGPLDIGEPRPGGVSDDYRHEPPVGAPTPPLDPVGVVPMPEQVHTPPPMAATGEPRVTEAPVGSIASARPHDVGGDVRPEAQPGGNAPPLTFAGTNSIREAEATPGWLRRLIG